MTKRKLNVGFHAITGCYGCLLSVLFNEDSLLDILNLIEIKAFPFVKSCNRSEKFDFVFMEGLVAKKQDIDELNSIRDSTENLVALGACACTGGVPAFRNFIRDDNYKHLVYHKRIHLTDIDPTPIDKYVDVDFYMPGCPPDKAEILSFLKNIATGRMPKLSDRPVCFECKLNRNQCLLDTGKLCLGPITRGNCRSVCTNSRLECWGCRGLTSDANIATLVRLLEEKGFNVSHIKKRMRSFAGLKYGEGALNGQDNIT